MHLDRPSERHPSATPAQPDQPPRGADHHDQPQSPATNEWSAAATADNMLDLNGSSAPSMDTPGPTRGIFDLDKNGGTAPPPTPDVVSHPITLDSSPKRADTPNTTVDRPAETAVASTNTLPSPTREVEWVTQVNKPVDNTPHGESGASDAWTRPDTGAVRAVLKNEGTSEWRLQRGEGTGGKPAPYLFSGSRDVIPTTADTEKMPETLPGAAAGAEQKPLTAWTRILRERTVADDNTDKTQSSGQTETTGGTDITKLRYLGPIEIVNRADGIDSQEQKELANDARHDADKAGQQQELNTTAPKLERARDAIAKNLGELAVQRVVVGVPDAETLQEVAPQVASVLRATDTHTWVPETDPITKAIKKYDSEAAALNAPEQADYDDIVSVTDYAKSISYPDKSVLGLDVGVDYDSLSVERNIPDGVETINLGTINRRGEAQSDALLPIKDLKYQLELSGDLGFGKSSAIIQLGVCLTEANANRTAAAELAGLPPPEHTSTVMMDGETASLPWEVATRLAALNIPDTHKVVNVIHFGDDEVRCIVPFLNPKYNTPENIRDNVSGIMSLSANTDDSNDVRSIKRYSQSGIVEAQKQGHHKMAAVIKSIPEALDRSDEQFPPDVKQHIDGFARGQAITDFVDGPTGEAVGKIGYEIDIDAILDHPGVTIIQLGNLSESGKAIVTAGLATLFYDRLAYREKQGTGGSSEFPVLEFIVDEASSLVKDSPATDPFTRLFTAARKRDIGLAYGTQLTARVSDVVRGNTKTTIAFHSGLEANREASKGKLGGATEAEIDWLVSPQAEPGMALLYGGRESKPGIMKVVDPTTVDRGEPMIRRNGEGIIDLGIHEKAYPKIVQDKAVEYMETKEPDLHVRWSVEHNAALGAEGFPLEMLDGPLLHDLQSMTGERAEIRDAVIQIAVEDRKLPKIVATRMLNRVRNVDNGEFDDQPLLELAKPQTYYNHPKALVNAHLAPPPLEDTPRYEASLGEIKGATGTEQLEQLRTLKQAAATTIVEHIGSGAINENTFKAATNLAGACTEDTVNAAKLSISTAVSRKLTPKEEEAINALTSQIRDAVAEKGVTPLTYDDMITDVEASLLDHETNVRPYIPALPLTKEEITFEESFAAPETGTAVEQLKIIEERARIKALNATKEYGPYERSSALFAYDPRRAGFTVNNIASAVLDLSGGVRGPIHDHQKSLLDTNRPEIVSALNSDDTVTAARWAWQFRTVLNDEENRIMTPEARKHLIELYSAEIRGMQTTAENHALQQKRMKAKS